MKILTKKFFSAMILSSLIYSVPASLADTTINVNEGGSSSNPTSSFSVVGLIDFYTPSASTDNTSFSSLTSSGKVGGGGGILSEFQLAGPVDFEGGLLFVHRDNTFGSSTFNYTQSSNWLMLPLSAKFRFAKYFAVGAGPYVGYRVGNPTNTLAAGSAATLNFDTNKQNEWEFGLQGSADFTLPISDNFGLLAEARVLGGLTNLSGDTKNKINSVDVLGLVGVQFMY